uniref:Granulins domain-containing protein n=1 Tax=Astyanax mexicanus TaxID=7994 RepID=A0A3B1IQR7_ASTMX
MLAVLVLLMAQLVSSAPDSPPSAVESTEPSVQWCDFKSYCPDCSTCCKNKAGVWTCCGQCCKDGKHCCESGYECDGSVSCRKGPLNIPAGLKNEPLTL